MTQLELNVTDNIQHLARGSRYRITGKRTCSVNDLKDDDILCVASGPDNTHLALNLEALNRIDLDWDAMSDAQVVMLQLDADSVSFGTAAEDGQIYLDFLIYQDTDKIPSEDEPQLFMRPVVEFTTDRFRKIGERGPTSIALSMISRELSGTLIRSWFQYGQFVNSTEDPARFYATALQNPELLGLCRRFSKDPSTEAVIQSYFDLAKAQIAQFS